MTELVVNYDENGILDKEHVDKLPAMDAKVALVSRVVLGVDELTQESLKLFSSGKNLEKLAKIEAGKLKDLVKRQND